MSTPKREKRPPKRYADSPVLLVNKRKKEQKVQSPSSGAGGNVNIITPASSACSNTSAVTQPTTPPRAINTPPRSSPGSPRAAVVSNSTKPATSTSPRASLASTTAALAARLNAIPPPVLASFPSIVPQFMDSAPNSGTSSPVPTDSQDTPPAKVCPIFKDPNFIHSTKGASGGKKLRVWKNLKQIVSTEKTLPWKPDDVTYGSLDAPPSFVPAKKYSDITGLPAKYTDPHTKVRYATTEEFKRIRNLTSDIATGYLTLRKANVTV